MKFKNTILFLTAGYALAQYQNLKIFKRFDPHRKTRVLDIPHTNVTFKSKIMRLHGNLFGENKKGLVVFSHGLGLNSDDYFGITKGFVENGYQVLAFDNTGTYRSEGINTVGLNQSVVDLRAALDYVMGNDELDKSNLILCGHSWGGYAVAAILNEYQKYPIKAVISLAGPDNSFDLITDWSKKEANGWGLASVPFTTMYYLVTFGNDFFKSGYKGINKSKVPTLIVHGTQDEMVAFDDTGIIAHREQITNPHVEYFVMKGSNHNAIFQDPHDINKVNPLLLERMIQFLDKLKENNK